MKLKLSLGEGGFQGLLIRHGEKLAFGLVVAVVAGFLYVSATKEGFSAAKSPLTLRDEAKTAHDGIMRDSWREMAPERITSISSELDPVKVIENPQLLAGLYPLEVQKSRTKIRDESYAMSIALDRSPFRKRDLREDPKLLAAMKVEAAGIYAPIAVRLKRPDSAWINDKDTMERGSDRPAAKPKPEAKKPARKGSEGPGGDIMNMMGPGRGGKGGAKSGSGGPSLQPPMGPMGPGGMPPGFSEMYGGEGSLGGPMMSAGGARKQLSRWFLSHYYAGASQQAGASAMGGQASRTGARSFGVVSVRAVVPYEKQFEEYEAALANRRGYVPAQDVPRYLGFVAERAEVSDDPKADLAWTRVAAYSALKKDYEEYAGVSKEIADEIYLLPGILTMPLPPILLRPLDSLSLHSDIPRRQLRTMPAAKPRDDTEKPKGTDEEQGVLDLPRVTPGGTTGVPMPGSEGMAGYPPTMPGYGPMMPGYGPGMTSGEGVPAYGPGMPGYGPQGAQVPKVKYKLVRFFDRTAERDKAYRYRVRLLLEDPNRPRNPQTEPNRRLLDKAVVQRLTQVEADEQTKANAGNKDPRVYYRFTEWSEPSNIVRVPEPEKVVAGAATPAKFVAIKLGEEASGLVQTSEPSGKLVAVVWDDDRATEIPAQQEVFHGTLLNFKQNADVLHPSALQVKTVENFRFHTETVVVDLRGGEELGKRGKDHGLTAPGEFLTVDRHGNLVACDEVDDTEEYRRLLFIDDSAGADRAGGSGPAMMYPGGMPTSGGGDFFGPGGGP